jgi:hypothetical protein
VRNPLNYPLLIFFAAFFLLWLAAWVGARLSQRRRDLTEDLRTDFGVSFSMATGRYDLRKTYEEAEANAIGTEYVRADLLPAADGAQVRSLLKEYTELRIRFYKTRDADDLRKIDSDTTRVQGELWAAASKPASAQPSPVIALALGGMNDVLNSQGYTQAAWWNRIPVAAGG